MEKCQMLRREGKRYGKMISAVLPFLTDTISLFVIIVQDELPAALILQKKTGA